MSAATPSAMAAQQAIEWCYAQGWTDGLPVVPCDEELLGRFLATTELDPDAELIRFKGVRRGCTVRDAAINAAMAGCLPEYFPAVIAAWQAIDAEGWASLGILQSTSGSAAMLLFNGPVREQLGLNSAGNVFGSGFRANATIGRAIRLTTMNVFGIRPHELDQATQGQPARYSACIAENEEDSPWAPFHADWGLDAGASAVTAMSIRSVSHLEARHTAEPEQLLHDFADTIARTGALLSETTHAVAVISPEHATMLARHGWGKQAVRDFLVEHAVVSRERLAEVGKDALSSRSRFRLAAGHPDALDEAAPAAGLRVLKDSSAIWVIVAGAANAGVSSVINLFGTGREARPVAL